MSESNFIQKVGAACNKKEISIRNLKRAMLSGLFLLGDFLL